MLLVDAGRVEEAKLLAEWLYDRTELTIPQRQQLSQFLARDVPTWRLQIERYIRREQPFQLSYQDAADAVSRLLV